MDMCLCIKQSVTPPLISSFRYCIVTTILSKVVFLRFRNDDSKLPAISYRWSDYTEAHLLIHTDILLPRLIKQNP